MADAQSWGGSWHDGRIAFSSRSTGGIVEVDEDGGVASELTVPDLTQGDYFHAWPELLPGRRGLLYTSVDGAIGPRGIRVKDFRSGEDRELIPDARQPVYLESGHLVYSQGDKLMGVAFDLDRLTIEGPPVELVDGVLVDLFQGAQFSVGGGSLVYVARTLDMIPRRVVWVDRDGHQAALHAFEQRIAGPRVSAVGDRLAVWLIEQRRIGVLDLTRKALSALPSFGHNDAWALVHPDGERIVFGSDGAGRGGPGLFVRRIDGTGDVERLTTSVGPSSPGAWTDGTRLVYMVDSELPSAGLDIGLVSLESGETRLLVATEASESQVALSPDDRWLAYVSDGSGRDEVWVTALGDPGRRVQVSTEGGSEPLFSPTRPELYYRDGEGNVWAVDYDAEDSRFSPGSPRLLFEGSFRLGVRYGRNYDITPDGERFVMIPDVGPSEWPREVRIVVNWVEELERRLAR